MLGRCDDVQALRSRFVGIDQPEDATALTFLTALFEASVLCAHTSAAEALLNRMSALANRIDGATFVSYGRLLGEAATLVGRNTEARDFFQQALEVCERLHFRPESALIHLELAEVLIMYFPNKNAEASEHLQTAIAEFQAMHMQPGLQRAMKLCARVSPPRFGCTPRRQPKPFSRIRPSR